MVEKRALKGFVGNPVGRFGEAVDLDWDAFGGGLQGPHHLEQIGADAGVRLQVTLHVTAENTHIHNVFRQIFLLCQSFFEEPFRLFRRAEPHRGGVEQDGTFDTPSAAFAHAAPVLERIADQRVRRDRRDRLVEILHRRRRIWPS